VVAARVQTAATAAPSLASSSAQPARPQTGRNSPSTLLLVLAGAAVLSALALAGTAWWLWRQGRRSISGE
jgi:hypothetical protein